KDTGSSPIRDVMISALIAIGLSVFAATYAYSCVRGAEADPGALASLSVVTAGFALAVFVFHLLRLTAARRLSGGAISPATIRAHLDAAEPL
ncbi:MAG TPA: hypothetical protein VMH26_02345, partial [Burkholderiales bacterium]|nr:hypothetical protein [Burkholderiales bacterium]